MIQHKQTGRTFNNECNMTCYLWGKRVKNIKPLKQNCTVTRKSSHPIPEETKFYFIANDSIHSGKYYLLFPVIRRCIKAQSIKKPQRLQNVVYIVGPCYDLSMKKIKPNIMGRLNSYRVVYTLHLAYKSSHLIKFTETISVCF